MCAQAMNVNKCTKAGGTFIFWVADWFALMNDKMGGDLHKIKVPLLHGTMAPLCNPHFHGK